MTACSFASSLKVPAAPPPAVGDLMFENALLIRALTSGLALVWFAISCTFAISPALYAATVSLIAVYAANRVLSACACCENEETPPYGSGLLRSIVTVFFVHFSLPSPTGVQYSTVQLAPLSFTYCVSWSGVRHRDCTPTAGVYFPPTPMDILCVL